MAVTECKIKCVIVVSESPTAELLAKVKDVLKPEGKINGTSLEKKGRLHQLIDSAGNAFDICVDITKKGTGLFSEAKIASRSGKKFFAIVTNTETGEREIIHSSSQRFTSLFN